MADFGPQNNGTYNFRKHLVNDDLYWKLRAAGGTDVPFKPAVKMDAEEYRKNLAEQGQPIPRAIASARGEITVSPAVNAYMVLPYATDAERANVDTLVNEWHTSFSMTNPMVVAYDANRPKSQNYALKRLGGDEILGPDGSTLGHTFKDKKNTPTFAPAEERYNVARRLLADEQITYREGVSLTATITDDNYPRNANIPGIIRTASGAVLAVPDATLTRASTEAALAAAIEKAQENSVVTDADLKKNFTALSVMQDLGMLSAISNGELTHLGDITTETMTKGKLTAMMHRADLAFGSLVETANALTPSEKLIAQAEAAAQHLAPEAANARRSEAYLLADAMESDEIDLIAARDAAKSQITIMGTQAMSLRHAVTLSDGSQRNTITAESVANIHNSTDLDTKAHRDRPMTIGGYTAAPIDANVTKLATTFAKTPEDHEAVAQEIANFLQEHDVHGFEYITKPTLEDRVTNNPQSAKYKPFSGTLIGVVPNTSAIVVRQVAVEFIETTPGARKTPRIYTPENAAVRVYNAAHGEDQMATQFENFVRVANKNAGAPPEKMALVTIGFHSQDHVLSAKGGQWGGQKAQEALDESLDRNRKHWADKGGFKAFERPTAEAETSREIIGSWDMAQDNRVQKVVDEVREAIAHEKNLDVYKRKAEIEQQVSKIATGVDALHKDNAERALLEAGADLGKDEDKKVSVRPVSLNEAYASLGIEVVRLNHANERSPLNSYNVDEKTFEAYHDAVLERDRNLGLREHSDIAEQERKVNRLLLERDSVRDAHDPDNEYAGSSLEKIQNAYEENTAIYEKMRKSTNMPTNAAGDRLQYEDMLSANSGASIEDKPFVVHGRVANDPAQSNIVVARMDEKGLGKRDKITLYVVEHAEVAVTIANTQSGFTGAQLMGNLEKGRQVEITVPPGTTQPKIEIIDREKERDVARLNHHLARTGNGPQEALAPIKDMLHDHDIATEHLVFKPAKEMPENLRARFYPIEVGPARLVAAVQTHAIEDRIIKDANVYLISDPEIYSRIASIDGKGKHENVGALATIVNHRDSLEITSLVPKSLEAFEKKQMEEQRAREAKMAELKAAEEQQTMPVSTGRSR